MHRSKRWFVISILTASLFGPLKSAAQIDPMPREMIQLGYNAAFEGHAPLSAYLFYYRNMPQFLRTNLTLRLAVAPTYLDSELGIRGVFGENTDLGIGLAGGGFADSYAEIRGGTYRPKESFVGHGGETSLSLYHCFNPEQQIPLNAVLRGFAHYTAYTEDDSTDEDFTLPENHTTLGVRSGLRWGGQEPILFPALAMELSVWYEGQYRTGSGVYGYPAPDPGGVRELNEYSHLFWGQALLAYTSTNSGQGFYVNFTMGTSINADRFSAYRLGALLPMIAEFPRNLPGYYYQELSAKEFLLLGGNYMVPLDKHGRWKANIFATTAGTDYLDGLEQSGTWHSGVGGGILYQGGSVKVMIGYAYGIDAIRNSGRGAQSIGFLMQMDLDQAKELLFNPNETSRWRGFQRAFGAFGR